MVEHRPTPRSRWSNIDPECWLNLDPHEEFGWSSFYPLYGRPICDQLKMEESLEQLLHNNLSRISPTGPSWGALGRDTSEKHRDETAAGRRPKAKGLRHGRGDAGASTE